MSEGEAAAARSAMIDSQLRPNKVTDERVIGAFAAIRRELFVPPQLRATAYVDDDLPLGGGRWLIEPMVTARLLQAATIARGDTVLLVGAGSGYEAAVIAALARNVVALEEDPALARRAREALVEHAISAANVVEGPLSEGYAARAPYDAILFGGAVAEVPAKIVAQLAEGGRLAAVVRGGEGVGRATLMIRAGGVVSRRIIFDAAVPFLPGFAPKPAFVF
jgi:protein-L-isoaspartate(D-aspartate) O-methyltransferase